jgi:hypothetical protein
VDNFIRSKKIIIFIIFVACLNVIAKESGDDEVHQVKVGNFAVRGTMQPGPLLGFGQNIVDQYDTLGVFYSVFNLGKDLNFTHIVPEVLYGLRDDLSIILAFPIAKNKYQNHSSSGMSDVVVQLEYAIFGDHKPTYTNQISLVGSMAFPSGNECKNPSIGFGSPSFFLGFVLEHLATEWYAYTSYGGFITTKNDTGIQSGNQFLYQAGFGKNIAYCPNRWICMWMVEFSGIYQKKSKVNGCIDDNSGSNSILIGPALWFSTDRVIVQAGAAPFVYQNLFGCGQLRSSCFISVYTAFRF